MTQSTHDSQPTPPGPSPEIPDHFACQNRCGRYYEVIIVLVGQDGADYLCQPCNLAQWLAVADQTRQLIDQAEGDVQNTQQE